MPKINSVTTLANLTEWSRRKARPVVESVNWWMNPTPTPSFVQKYMVARRVYAEALRLEGRPWGGLWSWETKLGVRDFAAKVGLAVPEMFHDAAPIETLPLESFPEVFVIKPVFGAGRAGVYVLRKEGSGYIDLLRGKRKITCEEIISQVRSLGDEGSVSADQMIAEEAILNSESIAYDWKVYSFQGETPLVWQIGRTKDGKLSRYYNSHWDDLGTIRWKRPVDSSLPRPVNPDLIMGAAQRVSLSLPIPFVRVDLYERNGEVFLGELTPMPGSSQRFQRSVDRAMGEAWERAESRLLLK